MNKQTKFYLTIGLQTAIILGVILFKFLVITTGTKVYFRVQPIDPTSPLRGDYMTFQYEGVSNVTTRNIPYTYDYNKPTPATIKSSDVVRVGDTVYSVLSKKGRYWTADYTTKEKPSSSDVFYIKGKVISTPSRVFTTGSADMMQIPQQLIVSYGIEEYFIPEGAGKNFTIRNNEVLAEVSIDASGNGVLNTIYVDGKKWP